jgi:hypothetical protein
VVQRDISRAKEGSSFKRIGSLDNRCTALVTALATLQREYNMKESKIQVYLDGLKEKWPKLAPKYPRSNLLEDILFKADHGHISESTTLDDDDRDDEGESCRFCDRTNIVKRTPRDTHVHFGLIASGNQVIKDAACRDGPNQDLGGHVLWRRNRSGRTDELPPLSCFPRYMRLRGLIRCSDKDTRHDLTPGAF